MTSDTIDYFMEQPDGANYVVLYQLLCLKTINTGGRLSRQIGEITIPYDIAKIQRDCKWFSADTIRVALANWKTLQQEQQNAAGSVADLKTDFTATMDELQTALAEDIEAMDLGDEAKASAQATIQGFIDGAVGMLPQVTAAYNRVAAAARAALSASGTGTAGSIPGYAVGTQSAAPGFALVGENGPELVYFNGGEQVMTAEETAAMRESMEIQAITFAPQLLEAMHAIQGDGALSASLPGQSSELPPIIIENTFHVEGNATPETIAALADYGDSLKEVVREAIAEIEEDASRTMYR